MPLIENSEYHISGFLYRNPHFTTIFVNKIRKTIRPPYRRERLELADGDFLDIDFVIKNKRKAVVLCHGLEGSSDRNYNNTAAEYFLKNDFSVFAWNNRSCSGEMNRSPKLYHHAAIDDLDSAVKFVMNRGFEEIYLLGFSMGGVQILNYFGKTDPDNRIKAGVAISSPIYLKTTAEILKMGFNRIYLENFLIAIKRKLRQKSIKYPDLADWMKVMASKDFDGIDEYFTAPVHGFSSADDYYSKASPGALLQKIRTPVLILNAMDDPFLGADSFPKEIASKSDFVFLETPDCGGHCAFPLKKSKFSYSEKRAYEFFNSEITANGL